MENTIRLNLDVYLLTLLYSNPLSTPTTQPTFTKTVSKENLDFMLDDHQIIDALLGESQT